MDGLCVEVLAADAWHGYRVVKQLPLPVRPADCAALVRQLGRKVPAKNWNENHFEALRIVDEKGWVHVYSMYDRASEHFGVAALKVGQLDAFKAAASFGLVN